MRALYIVPLLSMAILGGDLYYYQSGEKVFIESAKIKRDLNHSLTFSQNGKEKSVLNYILLKPKDELSLEKIKSLKELKFIEKIGDIYKFETISAISALEISAKLYEENLTIFSHPDFIQQREKRANIDELSFLNGSYSWHIYAINAQDGWQLSKGDGIKVAVYDDGIDYTHEDLRNNYLFGYNFDEKNTNVYPSDVSNDYHGTAVAGLISAEENGVGVIGVAPKSYLIGIKQMYESDTLTVRAFNFAKNNNIDVINCSWGTYDVSDAVKSSIVDLATNGRGGKGALVVFAVGNDGEDQIKWTNDESAIEEVIGVGATDNYNQRATFSNYGEKLDLVAPGGYIVGSRSSYLGVSSTDISGVDGHSSSDYILSSAGDLIGTSFSAPIVAGVIADILAVNPSLSRDEVKNILYSTTQKVGDINYRSKDDYTFNEEYGYGLVDANAAVLKAYESDFKFEIKKGWNLIGNVNKTSLETNDLFNKFAEIIYTYGSDWILNPPTIDVAEGFWLKAKNDYTYTFTNTGVVQIPSSKSNWQLFSATKNLRLNDNENLYLVYRSDGWHIYPYGDLNVIYKGEGYWTRVI